MRIGQRGLVPFLGSTPAKKPLSVMLEVVMRSRACRFPDDIEDLASLYANKESLLHFPQRQSVADDGRHHRSERGTAALQRCSQYQVISTEVIFAAWPLSFELRRNCQLLQLPNEPQSESDEKWPKASS